MWCQKYEPEVRELIRFGEERGHAWAVGRTGLASPRTPEEEAGAEATKYAALLSREGQMLLFLHGMAEEKLRAGELGSEAKLLDREIAEAWEELRFFLGPLAAGVINLKDRPRPDASEYVYIGRGLLAGKERFPPSKWANRFTVKQYGRAEALARYEEEIRSGPLWDELPELEGKVLACWCKPEPCHGDVLLRLIEERAG